MLNSIYLISALSVSLFSEICTLSVSTPTVVAVPPLPRGALPCPWTTYVAMDCYCHAKTAIIKQLLSQEIHTNIK